LLDIIFSEMNGIIADNIASFSEQIKSVLEQQVKSGQLITTADNVDEKQLTISISTTIANNVDIYHLVRDGVLYVYIFHTVRKGKKNLESRDKEQIHEQTKGKELIIHYKDAVAYNIILAIKGIANISKNVKKHKLEMITRLNQSQTLYKFMNKYLFMVDTNGTLFYYPDSIAITSLESWLESSTNKNNLAAILDGSITLEKYLLLNKFVSLECHLDATAYGLYDILGSNSPTASSTASQIGQELENKSNQSNQSLITNISDKCNKTQSECISDSTDASYSALGYILSWLNPLSYYNSISSNTASIIASNTSITSGSNSDNLENKTIAISSLDKQQDTRYFLDASSINCDLINIRDTQIKILKAQKIEIPAFITDIAIDKVDNIIISGRIDNQPINLKYNKYMLGMHLV